MKKNFNVNLKDFNGNDIQDKDGPINVSKLVATLLLAEFKDEVLTGLEKFERAELARKIHTNVEEYKAEDLTKIKEIVGKGGSSIVVWNVFNIIDKD